MSKTKPLFFVSATYLTLLIIGISGSLPGLITFGLLILGMLAATIALVWKIVGNGQYDSASDDTGSHPDSRAKKEDENVYVPAVMKK